MTDVEGSLSRFRDRPRVVVSVTASADGRVALNRTSVLLEPDALRTWRSLHSAGADELLAERRAWIESRHHPRVTMEGSGTFVTETAVPAPELPASEADGSSLRESLLPEAGDHRWFVVVDGSGRIRWTEKGDGNTRLLLLVCESTPLGYLSDLRRENIPYLVVGSPPSSAAATHQPPSTGNRSH